MSEIQFDFIGWNNSTDKDGTKHDKVWTSFSVGNDHYSAWGARGKKLQLKHYGCDWQAKVDQRRVRAKKELSYTAVDQFQLFSIFPNFEETVSKTLMLAVLSGKVK